MEEKIMLLITIVDREKGENIAAFYRSNGLNFNLIAPGYGAAGLEVLDFLGLTETEKDVVISVGDQDKIRDILPLVKKSFHMDRPGKGIAFTIPISGISGSKALRYISGVSKRNIEDE